MRSVLVIEKDDFSPHWVKIKRIDTETKDILQSIVTTEYEAPYWVTELQLLSKAEEVDNSWLFI